jgi:hypothetical protein
MRKRIKDEFADLPLSRQRKYQLRMKKQGCCTLCGEPAATAAHCLFHAIQSRERNRSGKKSQRRYLGAQSYELQLSAPQAGGRWPQVELPNAQWQSVRGRATTANGSTGNLKTYSSNSTTMTPA